MKRTLSGLVLSTVVLLACRSSDAPAPAASAKASQRAADLVPPLVQTPADCESSKKALDDFIATLPTSCEKDSDCGGYFLHEDTCLGATMLHTPGCPPAQKGRLFVLQENIRKVCHPDASTCAAAPYEPVCVSGKCVDAKKK
jgi:hypothetical protein